MSHTPEPWRISEGIGYERGTFGISPAMTDTFWLCVFHYNLPTPNPEQARANAARIVAAVNAVAGIPTEELTQVGLGGLAKLYQKG